MFYKRRWNLNQPLINNSRLRNALYDVVNVRGLTEGIDSGRWRALVRELKSLLAPGGWIQMVEVNFPIQLDSGRSDLAPNIANWNQYYSRGMRAMNRDPGVGRTLAQMLREAGFAHVQGSAIKLPIGLWEQGRSISHFGISCLVNFIFRLAHSLQMRCHLAETEPGRESRHRSSHTDQHAVHTGVSGCLGMLQYRRHGSRRLSPARRRRNAGVGEFASPTLFVVVCTTHHVLCNRH